MNKAIKKWAKLESKIKKIGLARVSKELITLLNIEVELSKKIDKWTKKGRGAIFVGLNHDSWIEAFIFFSLLKRDDFRAIGLISFSRLGKNYAKYILPVMERKYAWNYEKSSIVKWDKLLLRAENLAIEDVNNINKDTFDKAARNLGKGESILIFTTGGHGIKSKWGYGIEEIIKRIDANELANVDIVPFYFSGLKKWDVVKRISLAALNKNPPKLGVKITVGKILTLGNIKFNWEVNERGVFSKWLRWKLLTTMGFAVEKVGVRNR
ncbi:MAG: hypothetical protein WC686_02035 [Candidatus Shapirobacteria bacterium]